MDRKIHNQKGSVPILVLVGILVVVAIAGGAYYLGEQTFPKPTSAPLVSPTPQPTSSPDETVNTEQSRSANWKTYTKYTNIKYSFEFQHPTSFVLQETSGEGRAYNNNIMLADFNTVDGKKLQVLLDSTTFSIDYLKKYAPTGSEFIDPKIRAIGTNTFYYYGPGGGGVCYPDQYFINLNGKILIFSFDGCENDKTPSEEFKIIERQILSTFRFIDKDTATMEMRTVALCDFNADGRIDTKDHAIFRQAMGKKVGEVGYNLSTDVDADGVTTTTDEKICFPATEPAAP